MPSGLRREVLEDSDDVLEAARRLRRRRVRFDRRRAARRRLATSYDARSPRRPSRRCACRRSTGSARSTRSSFVWRRRSLPSSSHRIDVADAFVIGEEVDAIADPHRPARIAVGKRQPCERARSRSRRSRSRPPCRRDSVSSAPDRPMLRPIARRPPDAKERARVWPRSSGRGSPPSRAIANACVSPSYHVRAFDTK